MWSKEILEKEYEIKNGVKSFLPITINPHKKLHKRKKIELSTKEKILLKITSRLNSIYSKITGLFESWEIFIKFKTYEQYLRLSDLKPNELILDIGCGIGGCLTRFAAKYPHLKFVGIDVDHEKLQILSNRLKKNKIKNVEIYHASIFQHIFKKEVFSAVISTQCFEHFASSRYLEIFRKLSDLTKLGASICIEVPGDYYYYCDYKVYKRQMKKKSNFDKYDLLYDFMSNGIYPAFKQHQHYIHGFHYSFFNYFLPEDIYFVNYKYTICKLTSFVFQYKTLNKPVWGKILFIPEHILGRYEDKRYSKKSGFNLILNYRKVEQIPAHVYNI